MLPKARTNRHTFQNEKGVKSQKAGPHFAAPAFFVVLPQLRFHRSRDSLLLTLLYPSASAAFIIIAHSIRLRNSLQPYSYTPEISPDAW